MTTRQVAFQRAMREEAKQRSVHVQAAQRGVTATFKKNQVPLSDRCHPVAPRAIGGTSLTGPHGTPRDGWDPMGSKTRFKLHKTPHAPPRAPSRPRAPNDVK